MPLVEPPMESSTRSAFSIDAGVITCAGVIFDLAISTATAPERSATRMRSAVTAGGDALPGMVKVMPLDFERVLSVMSVARAEGLDEESMLERVMEASRG